MKQMISSGMRRAKDFFMRRRYVSGVTVIEMVLILVIIIALLLIFKNQLISLINTIFDKITFGECGNLRGMRKGEITAFLSIVFVLLLSFVMGILQVSSVQRSKSISRLAADRAVYSVFGEYHQGLLEKYHVFAVDGSYGTGRYEEDNLIRRMHYYGTGSMEHEITAVQYLTDNSAQAFREQVLEYMEQRYGVSLVRDYTGMTARWEEQEVQGNGMKEEQENVRGQIESLEERGQDTEELTESGENPFACVEQIEKKGILSLVMPEEMTLSGSVIDLDTQASYRSLRRGRGVFPARKELDGPEERLLFNEYILKEFENAAGKEEQEQSEENAGEEGKTQKSLSYEVEYILSGKESDKKKPGVCTSEDFSDPDGAELQFSYE